MQSPPEGITSCINASFFPRISTHIVHMATRRESAGQKFSGNENFNLEQKQIFYRFHGRERKKSNTLEI